MQPARAFSVIDRRRAAQQRREFLNPKLRKTASLDSDWSMLSAKVTGGLGLILIVFFFCGSGHMKDNQLKAGLLHMKKSKVFVSEQKKSDGCRDAERKSQPASLSPSAASEGVMTGCPSVLQASRWVKSPHHARSGNL
eukprot:superscaffoldBa00006164_g21213